MGPLGKKEVISKGDVGYQRCMVPVSQPCTQGLLLSVYYGWSPELCYTLNFVSLQHPPPKLFLRQHKDTSEKAGHPSCLRQLSLCSNHRVTELAMHACQHKPIDLVPSFYDQCVRALELGNEKREL